MKQEFTGVIQQHEGINGAYVEIPFDVEQIFGAKRVQAAVTFDGIKYRGSIVRMGGCYMIGLNRQIRSALRKSFGDSVFVTLQKDEEERKVELSKDFEEKLMKNKQALCFFNTLSYSRKKEYNDWILSAKKAETKTARIEKAVVMLAENKKLK